MNQGQSSKAAPKGAQGLVSLLFVPGSRPERYAKALAAGASSVCIDLEDAVPADGKEAARDAAIAAIGPRVAIRVNGVRTRAGLADLLALAAAPSLPELVLVPMVESAEEIRIVAAILGQAAAIVPLIETPRGLAVAAEIAAVPQVAAMMFGGGDFSAELGVALAWEPLAVARGLFLLACAQGGVPAIDVPYVDLGNADGLAEEARKAGMMGFAAKAAIHPAQLDAIHDAMRPAADAVAEAREAMAAFEAAGGAAVRFNGRMLEAPLMRRYAGILAAAGNDLEKNDA